MSLASKALYWTIAGVIVAVIAIVVSVALDDDAKRTPGQSAVSNQQQSGTSNNQQNGPGNTILQGDHNQVQINPQQFKDEVRGLTREQAEQQAEKYRTVAPKAGEPAPYLVLDAPHHLWVRSSGTTTGHHIGAAFNNATVWAECVTTTTFDPDRTDSTGPVWLRIRWPNEKPSDNLMASQPGDRYTGWVYAGQTLPAGHNGTIPTCTNP
jgi:hypothetical protein